MPVKVYYRYELVSCDAGGANRAAVQCGPYGLSAYAFDAVAGKAVCWMPPGLAVKEAKAEVLSGNVPIDPARPELGRSLPGPTGRVSVVDREIGPNGEFASIPLAQVSLVG